jgi:hypothetical protein
VRFTADHHFGAPPEAVLERLADPAFHTGLVLPDVAPAELVDAGDDGRRAWVHLRLQYVGQLDDRVRRLLGGRPLCWRQDLDVDRSVGGGTVRMWAEHQPAMLHGDARFTVTVDGDDEASRSIRHLQGELVVAVPVIGAMAERRIVPGVLARLASEAEQLDRQVSPPG